MKEVNISYYQQLLDKGRYNSSDRNFYQKVLDSIKKQGGKATDRQYNIIQQIKFGKTMYSSKNEHIYNKNNIMNQTTQLRQLRQLIKESIQEYIREIDEAGHEAGMKARMEATQEAINKRKKMTELAGLDEDVQKMIDERKVKEVNSEVKALEKSLAKLQKQFDKLASKANKGEKVEDTQWHRVSAWGKVADIIEKYVTKGKEIAIEGKLTHRSYDDKEGNKRYITEVVANDILLLGK